MNKFTIKYCYGDYSGIQIIYADDADEAIAKMWRQLRPHMSLSMAYTSAKIISTEEAGEDE